MLANVGTVVAFRSGSPADERLILPLFAPFVDEGEIANLPAYSFYVRIAAVETQQPMSGVTMLIESDGDVITHDQVIELSRKLHGKKNVSSSTATRATNVIHNRKMKKKVGSKTNTKIEPIA